MKKFWAVLLCLALAAVPASCARQPRQHQAPPKNMDLATYIHSAKLPKNVSVSFDPSKVKSPASAAVYSASFHAFDKDKDRVIQSLLPGKIAESKSLAEGMRYETGNSALCEMLTIYDGGRSFGKPTSLDGGLAYSKMINGEFLISKISTVISNAPGNKTRAEKSGFSSFSDLSFASCAQALSAVNGVLDSAGFPRREVSEAYSLDLDTMLRRYALYKARAKDPKEFSLTKDDECYLFFLRQTLDGIPLADMDWQEGNRALDEITETSASVLYSKNGLMDIRASGFYDAAKSGEDRGLIGAAQALDKLLDSYSGILVAKKTEIVSMELCYVGVKQENGYSLLPAWVIGLAEEPKRSSSAKGASVSNDPYSCYVVNAVTGKRIEKAGKGGQMPGNGK